MCKENVMFLNKREANMYAAIALVTDFKMFIRVPLQETISVLVVGKFRYWPQIIQECCGTNVFEYA